MKVKQKVPQQAIEQQNSVSGNTKSTGAKHLASPAHDIHFSIQKKEKDHSNGNVPARISPPASGINFTIQKKENKTGLPDHLKSGIENLSGHAMDDVKVHYNSSQPAQLNAHAYAQGNQIHIAPGQEKHLAHEAWHVVQQKQGRVKPTKQLKSSVAINDSPALEKEADVMGAKALISTRPLQLAQKDTSSKSILTSRTIQMVSMETLKQLAEKFGITSIGTKEVIITAIAAIVGISYSVAYGIISAGVLLGANYIYEHLTAKKADEEIETSLNKNKHKGSALEDLIADADPKTTRLILTAWAFPEGWSAAMFAKFKNLNYLEINNPKAAAPKDKLATLLTLPIKSLVLIRAEFMDADCYGTLAAMKGLIHLDLTRTITSEKAPGKSITVKANDDETDDRTIRQVTELSGIVITAFQNQIQGGIKYLNIKYCTALTKKNIQDLEELTQQHGCTLEKSLPKKQD